MNTSNLIGNISRDLKLSYVGDKAVLRFNLAVKRPYSKDKTDFISIVAWENRAELINRYCHKGSKVAITGHIQTGSYEKNGNKVYTTDVVCNTVEFLDSKKDSQSSNNTKSNEPKHINIDIDSSELPF